MYACDWEIEARYIKVKRGLESIEVKCILCHVFIMLICQFVHIWAAFTMSSAPWEGIVRPADRWHSKMCIIYGIRTYKAKMLQDQLSFKLLQQVVESGILSSGTRWRRSSPT